MSYKLRKYDLMTKTLGYNNGISVRYFVRVKEILSEDLKKVYNNYDIITGHGDKNSKVIIKVTLEFDEDLKKVDPKKIPKDFIDYIKRSYNYDEEENTILSNPHDVYKVDIDWEVSNIDEQIKKLQQRKNFILENQRRVHIIKEAFK